MIQRTVNGGFFFFALLIVHSILVCLSVWISLVRRFFVRSASFVICLPVYPPMFLADVMAGLMLVLML